MAANKKYWKQARYVYNFSIKNCSLRHKRDTIQYNQAKQLVHKTVNRSSDTDYECFMCTDIQ